MLTSRRLHFASPSQFEDLYEGVEARIIEAIRDQKSLNEKFDQDRKLGRFSREELSDTVEIRIAADNALRQSLSVLRYQRSFYNVSCWYNHSVESAAMWKLYTQSSEGLIIVSTFQRVVNELLNAQIDSDVSLFASNIIYQLHTTPDNAPIPLTRLLLHKHPSFASENEVRFLLFDRKRPLDPKSVDSLAKNGDLEKHTQANVRSMSVPVDVANIIEEVVISPAAPSWVANAIATTIRALGYTMPVRLSELGQDPYAFE
jgi:hypothetical protein